MKPLNAYVELRLASEDLSALGRAGYVASEHRGGRARFRLRFRRAGKQQTRNLGADPQRAAEIAAALQVWQAPRRQLTNAIQAVRDLRTQIATRRRATLAPCGFAYHGRELRKKRRRLGAVLRNGS